ncbi:MAPEG family protein [Pseudohoeflea suaedae]|nr:MAPEG family protein [Pseudohoeflea suaedae]
MLPITTILASIAAIALVALSVSVSLARMKAGVNLGMGDDPYLMRRIRIQGNFIEYVPLAVVVCGLAEFRGAGDAWLLAIAALLVIGRISHPVGMLLGSTPLRALGMLGTYGSLLVGAAALTFG